MENNEAPDFAEAAAAATLRESITKYATNAVVHGAVARDWVNARLSQLGAELVVAPAAYQICTPITGNYGATVTANSRPEALEEFAQYVAAVPGPGKGEFRSGANGQGVYGIQFVEGAETFHSGPEDFQDVGVEPVPGLDDLKAGIRQLIKDAVSEQGWSVHHAYNQLNHMGLDPLPSRVEKTVLVPVSGTATFYVTVFAGDDDEAVQAAAAGIVRRSGSVVVVPDEIGWVSERGADAMGLKLVDED